MQSKKKVSDLNALLKLKEITLLEKLFTLLEKLCNPLTIFFKCLDTLERFDSPKVNTTYSNQIM